MKVHLSEGDGIIALIGLEDRSTHAAVGHVASLNPFRLKLVQPTDEAAAIINNGSNITLLFTEGALTYKCVSTIENVEHKNSVVLLQLTPPEWCKLERRRAKRINTAIQAELHPIKTDSNDPVSPISIIIVGLSESGARIQSKSKLERNQMIKVVCTLPNNQLFTAVAEIVRINPMLTEKHFEAGIEFIEFAHDSNDALKNYLQGCG